MGGYFVTGTDTGVGKTLVGCALVEGFRRRGRDPAAMKPVAAGAVATAAGPRNDDALALMAAMAAPPPYERVNPYLVDAPIAPHIAAEREGISIDIQVILDAYHTLCRDHDPVVVEGAGGWLVPIDHRHTLADVATRLALPVVMVVGIRLGCINHCLLTVESIARAGLPLAGWVATYPEPYPAAGAEVVASLEARVPAPLRGVLPYRPGLGGVEAADLLDLDGL